MTMQTLVSQSARLDGLFSRRAQKVSSAPLLQGMDKVGQRISFIFGFPDPASLPAAEVAAMTTQVLSQRGEAALQYGDNAGYSGLIDALIAKLARDQGIRANRENILITAGGSQAIDLLLDTLVDWGDTIVSEMPTWLGAVQAFQNVGADIISIPIDNGGIDVGVLDRELRRLRDKDITPKFIYANANFQNPTGATMSSQRRADLLALARSAGTVLIEDDAYFDLRYDGESIPSIYSMDTSNSVVYMGTLSKTMGPGMRLGWLVGPPELIRRVSALKVDGGTNVFGAHVAADWLPENLLPHVGRLREVYHRRRDLMLAALEQHMPPGSTWSVPEGGFFVWLTLPEDIDTTRMLAQVQELGVEYLPGPTCYADRAGSNQLRLSYSFVTDELIEPGIRIIGDVIRAELSEARSDVRSRF
ncbi:MAG: PLP-dependent aminotransferase family protein [Chloroflexia bacterium]|nr:PLP-dependent aminotransferase family protein [Chloroflexia bacterium]